MLKLGLLRLSATLTRASVTLSVLCCAAWGALALLYKAPVGGVWRVALAAGLLLLAWFAMVGLWRRRALMSAPALAAFAALAVWWAGIPPSNTRDWAGDVARSVTASVKNDTLTISNVRNFRWTGETSFEPYWETRSYDLGQVAKVDLFASHWDGENIAHILVSFGFSNGEHLAWSAELRRVAGQEYETVASMFKLSELILIAADERDLIGVRALQRGEDVRLYPLRLTPEMGRKLLMSYARAANELAANPRWYNVLTNNCTTVILDLARTLAPDAAYDWRVLLPGFFPEYAWDHGALDRSIPFAVWRERAGVSTLAKSADLNDGSAFSATIRALAVPGR
jgi:hypothetical protein